MTTSATTTPPPSRNPFASALEGALFQGPANPASGLPSEKITALRQYIRAYGKDSTSLAAIDQAIREKYGVGAKDIMSTTLSDKLRDIAGGLTLNHADELGGLLAKFGGGSYSSTRDQIRANDAAYANAQPWAHIATSALAGVVPGLATLPIIGSGGGGAIGLLRAAGAGALGGAVAGEGASNATTASGIVSDAGLPTALGATLGVVGSAIGQSAHFLPNNKDVVARGVASQLPNDAGPMLRGVARQQDLAPNTVVLADQSPQVRNMARIVGEDGKAAMQVTKSTQARIAALQQAQKDVGKDYNLLKNVNAPVDQSLQDALDNAGASTFIKKGQGEVNLADLHTLRGEFLDAARDAGRAGRLNRARILRNQADGLTNWMQNQAQVPWLRQTDADYAFLTDRVKAAQQTLKTVLASGNRGALNRVTGTLGASPGGSIPVTSKGVGTTVMQILTKPQRAARARAMADLLFTPHTDPSSLQDLVNLHDFLLSAHEGPSAGQAALFGGVLPQAGTQFVSPPPPVPQ